MEKELLTKGRIKADLQRNTNKYVIACLVHIMLIPIVFIIGKLFLKLLFIFFNFNANTNYTISLLYAIIFCVVFALLSFCDIFKIVSALKQKNSNLIITNDFVVDKQPLIVGGLYANSKPYTLIFAQSGKYGIPSGTNFPWSNLYKMSDKQFYQSTDRNDEFYVITIHKKPVLAYNKKYFELDE